MHRRSFIEMFIAGTAGYAAFPSIDFSDGDGSKWKSLKKQFPDGASSVLNFNNGSAGMVPKIVEKQLAAFTKEMNRMPPFKAAEIWSKISGNSKLKLSKLIGAQQDEIAIIRNTTEGLNYVLKGIEIPKNSTVICAKHDYGHSINILERLSKEKEFNLKYVDIELPAKESKIIDAYKEAIDENCSLVLLTAMTHREGQILPIKKLTKIAKSKGALVLVDAAHSIGHYEHSVSDWDCDYYCTSLHKWLSCPIGCGLLYMKKDLIAKTKGSYSASKKLDGQMLKFEDVGTKPFAIEASILSALHFQERIGLQNKFNRLKFLTNYWTQSVEDIPNVQTFKPENYGAVSSFHFPRLSTDVLAHFDSRKVHIKKVYAKYYDKSTRTRYRISPNIYHTLSDINRFIDALKALELKK